MFRLILVVFLALSFMAAASSPAAAFNCMPGSTKPCGSNVGACREGTRTCVDGEWGECLGGSDVQDEVCNNGIDDDCDGLVDECVGSVYPLLIVAGFFLLFLMALIKKMGF